MEFDDDSFIMLLFFEVGVERYGFEGRYSKVEYKLWITHNSNISLSLIAFILHLALMHQRKNLKVLIIHNAAVVWEILSIQKLNFNIYR